MTTDDCYTPDLVYKAVAEYVAETYHVNAATFVRPFWPGGDYQAYAYDDSIVVDNPPFSILAQIIRFYCAAKIPFFLFAPALTLFTAVECPVCYLPCAVSVTYANGAVVVTSFVTNMDTARVRTAPDLYRRVQQANKAVQKANKATLPKYEYPNEVITAAIVQRWSKYGVNFAVMPEDCIYTGALDSQRKVKKAIFGGGFLLRPKAAAERAAAERWQLSPREKEMLGMEAKNENQLQLW